MIAMNRANPVHLLDDAYRRWEEADALTRHEWSGEEARDVWADIHASVAEESLSDYCHDLLHGGGLSDGHYYRGKELVGMHALQPWLDYPHNYDEDRHKWEQNIPRRLRDLINPPLADWVPEFRERAERERLAANARLERREAIPDQLDEITGRILALEASVDRGNTVLDVVLATVRPFAEWLQEWEPRLWNMFKRRRYRPSEKLRDRLAYILRHYTDWNGYCPCGCGLLLVDKHGRVIRDPRGPVGDVDEFGGTGQPPTLRNCWLVCRRTNRSRMNLRDKRAEYQPNFDIFQDGVTKYAERGGLTGQTEMDIDR